MSFWFDLKNLNGNNCDYFFDYLKKFNLEFNKIFFEINNLENIGDKKFAKCIDKNSTKYNIGLSFEAILDYCDIKSITNYKHCRNKSNIDFLFENTNIKSVSLNYQKLKEFDKFPFNEIKVNLYNLKPSDIKNLEKNFKTDYFVIDSNYDPNSL